MQSMRKTAYALSVVVASGAVLAQSVGDPSPFMKTCPGTVMTLTDPATGESVEVWVPSGQCSVLAQCAPSVYIDATGNYVGIMECYTPA